MGRTIDADVLKAAFEMDGFKFPYVARMIDACPTVGEWISVKDRLPEEDKWVLAYYGKFHGEIMSVMCRRNGCWIDECFREDEEMWITHWMPLPEPPKEES